MSQGSNIEWTESTWNPVVGCSRVSAGCDHCYAVGMTRRLEAMAVSHRVHQGKGRRKHYVGLTVQQKPEAIAGGIGVGGYHFNGKVRGVPEALGIPLGWKKPRRIFVNSMSDLFHEGVPFEFIDRVFAVMALCPQHTFQVLTKRPERMAEYLNDDDRGALIRAALEEFEDLQTATDRLGDAVFDYDVPLTDSSYCCVRLPPTNAWLGTSVEDQVSADERIPHLRQCPAAVRFLSAEPLLGAMDLTGPIATGQLHWVIVGGESGPGARSCNLAWIRGIVEQCKIGGVPCFVKQMGHVVDVPCYAGDPEDQRWATSRPMGWSHVIHDEAKSLYRVTMPGKGGDPETWPEGLRVRQYPAGASIDDHGAV
jgi:protein gp37